ncbi:tail protein X [Solibacillus sp.]|uniref:tail protein X n=1 Tax=Solibacillus sp. TaxID=1909654 RepID=UPI003314AF10
MNSYTTIQGDIWDLIAFRIWGSEFLFPLLLEANPKYRHVHVFDGGIKLNVPQIDTTMYTPRPAWLGDVEV